MLDLRLLKTFIVVGRLLHFGRAAAALSATQPGVTQHIARLEEQLGFALFKRSKRSVSLTEAGALFLRRAGRLLALAERIEAEARAVAAGEAGQLALGLSSAIVYSEIPALISAFKQAHPTLGVRIAVHAGDALRELLDAEAVDAAITTLPVRDPGYRCLLLDGRTAMGVALPAGHRLARAGAVSMRALRGETFVVVPRDQHPEAHDALAAAMLAGGTPLDIGGREVSFPNLVARVALGEGVGLVPLAYAGMAPQSVRVVPLGDPGLARLKIYLIARADNDHPALARFIAAMTGHKKPLSRSRNR